MEIVHRTEIAKEWIELAKQLRTHPENARACWEIWLQTRVSDKNVPSQGLDAFQNRLFHFSAKSGLPSGKAVSFCRIFAVREQQMYPEIPKTDIPGGSAAVPLSSLAKSKVVEVEVAPAAEVVEDIKLDKRRKRFSGENSPSADSSDKIE